MGWGGVGGGGNREEAACSLLKDDVDLDWE